MSYFSQMAGLAVQNFVSAAVGMAVLAAVIRGFASRGVKELGNFWRDVTRTLLYILLPLAFDRGADPRLPGRDPDARRLRHAPRRSAGVDQTLALGPAASQIAIKQLGTNGGGFFNVNSAFPFENPTAVLELRRGALHPADPRRARPRTFGRMVGNRRQGWALYAAMVVILGRRRSASPTPPSRTAPRHSSVAGERAPPSPTAPPAATSRARSSATGSPTSALWANVTTDASNGSVNSAHDSYTGHRRPRPADQHDDRGGDLRRGRLGSVRDAA